MQVPEQGGAPGKDEETPQVPPGSDQGGSSEIHLLPKEL